MEMLQSPVNGKATPIVVRALGKLGDSKLIDTLLPFIARPEREIRIEAIQALSRLADESRMDQVRSELQAQVGSPDQTISRMAAAAVSEAIGLAAVEHPTDRRARTDPAAMTDPAEPHPFPERPAPQAPRQTRITP